MRPWDRYIFGRSTPTILATHLDTFVSGIFFGYFLLQNSKSPHITSPSRPQLAWFYHRHTSTHQLATNIWALDLHPSVRDNRAATRFSLVETMVIICRKIEISNHEEKKMLGNDLHKSCLQPCSSSVLRARRPRSKSKNTTGADKRDHHYSSKKPSKPVKKGHRRYQFASACCAHHCEWYKQKYFFNRLALNTTAKDYEFRCRG